MNSTYQQQQEEISSDRWQRQHVPLHVEAAATTESQFVDEENVCRMAAHDSLRKVHSTRRRKQQRSSFSSSHIPSSILGYLGASLLVLPLWMHVQEHDSWTEFSEVISAPSSVTIPLMASIGLSWLFTVIAPRMFPSLVTPLAIETAMVVLWYGLTIVAALQAFQVSEASTRVLSISVTIVCWILAGWHAFEWKIEQEARQQQRPRQESLPALSPQSLISGMTRASLVVTLPLAMVYVGLPHMLSHWITMTTVMMQRKEDLFWLQTSHQYPDDNIVVVLLLRIVGVAQLALAAMIVQWRDDMVQGYYSSGNENKSMVYLPLVQLVVISLPTHALGAILSFEKDDPLIQLGHGIMFMAIAGTSVWMGVRMMMST